MTCNAHALVQHVLFSDFGKIELKKQFLQANLLKIENLFVRRTCVICATNLSAQCGMSVCSAGYFESGDSSFHKFKTVTHAKRFLYVLLRLCNVKENLIFHLSSPTSTPTFPTACSCTTAMVVLRSTETKQRVKLVFNLFGPKNCSSEPSFSTLRETISLRKKYLKKYPFLSRRSHFQRLVGNPIQELHLPKANCLNLTHIVMLFTEQEGPTRRFNALLLLKQRLPL